MTVACAVLAAGGSVRMGQPKQLLTLEGEPLIRRIVRVAEGSRCEHVAVVLGAEAQAISRVLAQTRATVLLNPAWAEGMASSLHVAVRWAQQLSADGLLICACDQPQLTSEHLDALHAAHQRERRTIASSYEGMLGVPALLDASLFERLLAIRGDRGAASLLRGRAEVGHVLWPEGALDLDTPLDLSRFTARSGPSPS